VSLLEAVVGVSSVLMTPMDTTRIVFIVDTTVATADEVVAQAKEILGVTPRALTMAPPPAGSAPASVAPPQPMSGPNGPIKMIAHAFLGVALTQSMLDSIAAIDGVVSAEWTPSDPTSISYTGPEDVNAMRNINMVITKLIPQATLKWVT
jgi:hypothetical protein